MKILGTIYKGHRIWTDGKYFYVQYPDKFTVSWPQKQMQDAKDLVDMALEEQKNEDRDESCFTK